MAAGDPGVPDRVRRVGGELVIAALVLAVALLSGTITYYAEGVMERVRAYRGLSCAECIGAVALLPAEDIGRRVWLQRPGEAPEGPFLVVDCAQAEHRSALEARGIVGEVDWPTARRWDMWGPLAGVRVWYEDPGQQMPAMGGQADKRMETGTARRAPTGDTRSVRK